MNDSELKEFMETLQEKLKKKSKVRWYLPNSKVIVHGNSMGKTFKKTERYFEKKDKDTKLVAKVSLSTRKTPSLIKDVNKGGISITASIFIVQRGKTGKVGLGLSSKGLYELSVSYVGDEIKLFKLSHMTEMAKLVFQQKIQLKLLPTNRPHELKLSGF